MYGDQLFSKYCSPDFDWTVPLWKSMPIYFASFSFFFSFSCSALVSNCFQYRLLLSGLLGAHLLPSYLPCARSARWGSQILPGATRLPHSYACKESEFYFLRWILSVWHCLPKLPHTPEWCVHGSGHGLMWSDVNQHSPKVSSGMFGSHFECSCTVLYPVPTDVLPLYPNKHKSH